MRAIRKCDVEAFVSYIVPGAYKPYSLEYEPPAGVPRRSASYRDHLVRICDARSLKRGPTLDREGFALRRHATTVVDFYDESEVRKVYYAELEQLVKDATGASSVIVFDHMVRGSAAPIYDGKQMVNHVGGLVLVGDHVYGSDERALKCMELKTGKVVWENNAVGKGSVACCRKMKTPIIE